MYFEILCSLQVLAGSLSGSLISRLLCLLIVFHKHSLFFFSLIPNPTFNFLFHLHKTGSKIVSKRRARFFLFLKYVVRFQACFQILLRHVVQRFPHYREQHVVWAACSVFLQIDFVPLSLCCVRLNQSNVNKRS